MKKLGKFSARLNMKFWSLSLFIYCNWAAAILTRGSCNFCRWLRFCLCWCCCGIARPGIGNWRSILWSEEKLRCRKGAPWPFLILISCKERAMYCYMTLSLTYSLSNFEVRTSLCVMDNRSICALIRFVYFYQYYFNIQ